MFVLKITSLVMQHVKLFARIFCSVFHSTVFEIQVIKSVYIAKSRQRYYKTLNNIFLHVPNHALKDMYMLTYEL